MGPRPLDGYGLCLERWSEEPSTATRAERFGGATGLGYSGLRRAEAHEQRPEVLVVTAAVAAARAGAVRAVNGLELLEAAPGADRHARERALRQVHGHLRLVAQALVEPREERAAAGEHDAAIHDVRSQLRRSLVERRLDRLDDLRDRLVERA